MGSDLSSEGSILGSGTDNIMPLFVEFLSESIQEKLKFPPAPQLLLEHFNVYI